MRYLFGFICVLALGVMGCSETSGAGGSGGDGGSGGITECQSPEDCDDDNECTDDTCSAGVCEFVAVPDRTGPDEPGGLPGEGTTCGYYAGTCEGGSCAGTFACTEAGIREAIAAGAGPHTFNCDGAQTVVTLAEIEIDNDVILDGEGNLTVDGDEDHMVFQVGNVTAELHGFTVTGGVSDSGGGIMNISGTLTITNSTVSGNTSTRTGGSGIFNGGTLMLTNSTVSANRGVAVGHGIMNISGTLTITNSTVSGNTGYGIDSSGTLTITNSTVSGNTGGGIQSENDVGTVTLTNTLIDGNCAFQNISVLVSNGYNIESPGNTCGFDQTGDQSGVTAEQLNLEPLADNGGPTMTHALLTEPIVSVAVDVIPADDCVDAEGELLPTDQRGEPRFVGLPFGPSEPVGDGCDVGAFEVQPEP